MKMHWAPICGLFFIPQNSCFCLINLLLGSAVENPPSSKLSSSSKHRHRLSASAAALSTQCLCAHSLNELLVCMLMYSLYGVPDLGDYLV